eukprot:TRINITY_DN49925_c0_g1_i1.p1 TRINITY_DN49925_c0_g1~~TRINITY_DN49925_c0_g1_i1.p1  ORF type:complete len:777 (+),score=139.55 TRINITY_DN49925_c0_g1_i1:80-2410(+)
MPVPWPERPTVIHEVADRAIKVQQLRDLQLFLQRLCKMGMLVNKGEHVPAHLQGSVIDWSELNMYHICDLVIKPVIKFLEASTGHHKECSWVELVGNGPQPPAVLFSHWWGGRFRDFMAVINDFVRRESLSTNTAIWICTFANSQFGEDFGVGLRQSPFFKAIQVATTTLLVVDRDGGSLTRIWCALEMHFTSELGNVLEIYTPAGRVGSRRVTSGPLVEAVGAWDVTLCEASQVTDRRQILNFLADEAREKDGLRINDDGSLALVDGWRKELADKSLSFKSRARLGGEKEFEHEAQLFDRCAEQFQALSMKVRNQVQAAARETCKGEISLGCDVARLEDRGITLGQFRIFMKKAKAWANSASTEGVDWNTLTCFDLVDKYVKPKLYLGSKINGGVPLKEDLPERSYMEEFSTGIQRPRFKIDHSFGMFVKDTFAAVEWHAEAQQLGDLAVYWFDVLAFRMGVTTEDGRGESWMECQSGWREQLNRDADGTVFLWVDDSSLIDRIWRMRELQVCFRSGAQIDFSCKSGALACTRAFPDGGWEFGRFDPNIARKLLAVDFKSCKASADIDTKTIAAWFQDAKGGVPRFHDRLVRVAAGPVIRDAAREGKTDEIQRICKTRGFTLNGSSLKGSLGNTAVHVAAATGNTEALRVLLEQLADPNAQDQIRETPLHYAAFTGHARCAQILLKYGANAFAESSYGETPSDVAEADVAAFLGTRTKPVYKLLTTWEAVEKEQEDDALPLAAPPVGNAPAAARQLRNLAREKEEEEEEEYAASR